MIRIGLEQKKLLDFLVSWVYYNHAMIFWMIYIKPMPQNVENFILDMAKIYENRYGKLPNQCHFSHRFTKITEKINDISMIHDKYVPKFQFWFTEEKEDGLS